MYVSNVLQEPLPVIVSCVEEIGPPFRVHPHKLLGNDCSDDGVCRVKLLPENNMTHEFNNLKLQCVRKDDIIHELAKRQHSNVDPFNQGFDHASKMETINLHSVRVCFEVDTTVLGPQFNVSPPVVSNVIQNEKKYCNLRIVHSSRNHFSVEGGQKVIILLNRNVSKDHTTAYLTLKNNSMPNFFCSMANS